MRSIAFFVVDLLTFIIIIIIIIIIIHHLCTVIFSSGSFQILKNIVKS